MLLPVKNLSSVVSKVFFPAFSQRQDDLSVLADNYLKLIKYIAVLTFPMLFGLSLVSKEFVLLFLGEKWLSMIPVLSILSIVGALQSIVTLNGVIYYSLGKTKIAFRISLLVNFVLLVSFFVGVQYGIKGVAWSYLLANILLFYPVYTTAISLLNLKISRIFTTLKSVIAATFAMAVGVYLIALILNVTLLHAFILKVSFGLFIYLWVLYQLEPKFIETVLLQIQMQIKRVRNEDN
jgi:PST family polysaccharide transporter